MIERLNVFVPAGSFSDPIDLGARELVGAYLLPLSGAWPVNQFQGNQPYPAALQIEIGAGPPIPSTWQPLPTRTGDAAHVKYPLPFGSDNAALSYAPMPDEYRDLPSPIRIAVGLPVDATVILVVKSGCAISVNC